MNTSMQHARSTQLIHQISVTRWHNPTDKTITAEIIEDGQVKIFSVPPGESRDLDSKYDRAIHQVDCGKNECHRNGWWCMAGHEGIIRAGVAPLLQRVGKNDKLDPSLDPDAQAKKSFDIAVRNAAAMGSAHNQALLAAAEKMHQAGQSGVVAQAGAPVPPNNSNQAPVATAHKKG